MPGPNFALAAERIAVSYNKAQRHSVDDPIFLLGDFNKCVMSTHLPNLEQYVTCPTRKDRILDQCFGNVEGAYVPRSRPPLGRSDHNVIHLLPKYRQKLKREKPVVKSIQSWTEDSIEELRGCFEATEWDLFLSDQVSCNNPELMIDTVTSYITFCVDNVIETKDVRIYPNNKPWVNKEIKHILHQKKLAFLEGDQQKVRDLEKEISRMIKEGKKDYKDKVEKELWNGNARDAWRGLNAMMGRKQKAAPQCDDPVKLSNDLNMFYSRFDKHDFSNECDTVCAGMTPTPVTIKEQDVISIFQQLNPHKAPGPDGLKGRVLKECATQLGPIFTQLFQMFLNISFVPQAWKTATIVPVPKTAQAKLPNDFRPIALTSLLSKCMERVVSKELSLQTAKSMDPMQFAYRPSRGVEDATLTLLDRIHSHLDEPRRYVRVLFMDFSSAFNTVQPHLLLRRLCDLNVSSNLILWIREFLRERPQRVCINNTFSDSLVLNTGVPQGCVLSPLLFSLYTNELKYNNKEFSLIKYADDMALVACLQDVSSPSYSLHIDHIATWFESSFLDLNVTKTKELCLGGGSGSIFRPVTMSGEEVEQVTDFKYLGTIIDNKLTFQTNAESIYKKARQRLYLLRQLRSFNASKHTLTMVYRSLTESVLTFNIVSWYGNLSVRDRNKLTQVVKQAGKIIGDKQLQLQDIYNRSITKKAIQIYNDSTHPLRPSFELLPSGRRLRTKLAKKKGYKTSFVPTAVEILNKEIFE